MINVQLREDGFTVDGHAEHGAYGEDIVCSAISMISQTILGMLRQEGVVDTYEVRFGHVNCHIKEMNERSKLLLDTLKYGVINVASAYPKNVKITEISTS